MRCRAWPLATRFSSRPASLNAQRGGGCSFSSVTPSAASSSPPSPAAAAYARLPPKRRGSELPAPGRFKRPPEDGPVEITAARLDQLLEAEITTLSLREASPFTLLSVLESSTDAGKLAFMLHEELPTRFAQRIKMLEALPDWRLKRPIADVRCMCFTSFKQLRLADPDQPERFQEQLYLIKKRHSPTTLLVGGFKEYAQVGEMTEANINAWLDRFFTFRISTNLLIAHYLQIARRETSSRPEFEGLNPYQSSINPRCNPRRIAELAAEIVTRMCFAQYGTTPQIQITEFGVQDFPFVPRYLFYIFSELLKNAVRATVEKHLMDEMPPVRVIVSGDEDTATVRISDQGGGIPLQDLERMWSYLYSTADPVLSEPSRQSVDMPTDVRLLKSGSPCGLDSVHSTEDPEDVVGRPVPLAGLGCGLPLCQLYARYLGGRVELQTLPGYGVDVFVYLNYLGPGSRAQDRPTQSADTATS